MGRIKPPSGLIFRRASKPERANPWKDAVQQENYQLTLDDTVKMLGAAEQLYTSPLVRDMVGGLYKGGKWLFHDAWTDEEADFKKAAAARAGAPPGAPGIPGADAPPAPLEGTSVSYKPVIDAIRRTTAKPEYSGGKGKAAPTTWTDIDITTLSTPELQEHVRKVNDAVIIGHTLNSDELNFFGTMKQELNNRLIQIETAIESDAPAAEPVAAVAWGEDNLRALRQNLANLSLGRADNKIREQVYWHLGHSNPAVVQKGIALGNELLDRLDPVKVMKGVVETVVPPGPPPTPPPPAAPTPAPQRAVRPQRPTATPRAAIPYADYRSTGAAIADRAKQIPGWTEEVAVYLDQLAQQPEFVAAIQKVPIEGRAAFLENLVTIISKQLGGPAAQAQPQLDLTPFRIRPGASLGEAQAMMAGLARAGGTPQDAAFIINYGVGNLSEDDLGEWLSSGRRGGTFRSPMALSQHLFKAYEGALTARTKAGVEAEKSELRQAQIDRLQGRSPQAAASVAKTQAQTRSIQQKNEFNRFMMPIKAGQGWANLEKTLMGINNAAKPYIRYNTTAKNKPSTKPPDPKALEAFRAAIASNTKSLNTFSRQYLKGHSGKLTAVNAQLAQLNSEKDVNYEGMSMDEKIHLFGGSTDRLRAAQKRANEDRASRQAEIEGLRRKRLALTAQKQRVTALIHDITRLQTKIDAAVLRTKSKKLTAKQRTKLEEHLTNLQETLATKQYQLTEIMDQ